MDITKLVAELRQEHSQISDAIQSLERMRGNQKRLGRPPKWMAEAGRVTNESKPPGKRGRPPGSKNHPHLPKDEQ
jgi:hypothetical protein